MKILFLCGSLQPGHDGVGDYTRRLCGELQQVKGCQVQILSLCDNQAKFFSSEQQVIDGAKIEVHRISMSTAFNQRYMWTLGVINKFQPDWISIQFVPYSFNPKGLPFWLPLFVNKLKGNHKWHIMFHELWIGMFTNTTFKEKSIGLLQKTLISRILIGTPQMVINTQTDLYLSKIKNLGYNVQILPLFSNIIKNSDSFIEKTANDLELKFCLFGSIHFGAPVQKFIDDLKLLILQLEEIRTLKFIFIGNCGAAIEEWTKVLLGNKINFEVTGFVTDLEISSLLLSCKYGISTTPYLLNQKSGSLAAMFDHQLAVLCVARKWEVKGFIQERFLNLTNYENKESINNFLSKKFIITNDNTLEYVGTKFLNGLK